MHEHFKVLEEVALAKAYIFQKKDGSWSGFNCAVVVTVEGIEVTPSEDNIKKLHFNAKAEITAKIVTGSTKQTIEIKQGMQWIPIK